MKRLGGDYDSRKYTTHIRTQEDTCMNAHTLTQHFNKPVLQETIQQRDYCQNR